MTTVYAGALGLFALHGWTQGVGVNDAGEICLGEALSRAFRGVDAPPDDDMVVPGGVAAVFAAFRDRVNAMRLHTAGLPGHQAYSVVGWNDFHGRTWPQVEDTLRRLDAAAAVEGVDI